MDAFLHNMAPHIEIYIIHTKQTSVTKPDVILGMFFDDI